MNSIQKIGVGILLLAITIFTLSLGLSEYRLTEESLVVGSDNHKAEILAVAEQAGILEKTISSNPAFIKAFKKVLKESQQSLNEKAKQGIPEGIGEWDFKMGDWVFKDYIFNTTKASSVGMLADNPLLFFLLFNSLPERLWSFQCP